MPDDSVLLGQLAEEFSAKVRQGLMPDVEDYAGRHPGLADRIRALFPTLLFLEGMAGGGARTIATADPARDLRPGTTFGNFRIQRELGRGGMGVVYEAIHLALNKRVALKVLPVQGSREATHLERFLREAQTAAGLHHTNIVPVFDVGVVNGVPYYAMQLIEGRGLDRVMIEGLTPTPDKQAATVAEQPTAQFEPGQTSRSAINPAAPAPPKDLPQGAEFFQWVAQVGIQAAEGLAYAHQRGIIHRDIKPSNLILDHEGVLWITDFGLARRADDPALTQSGTIIGTPRYMSPEQAEGAKRPIDHRTDIYSLGATLYELVARRPAFDGPTPLDIVMQILDRTPVAPRRLNAAVPRDLETIILKAMAKRPEDRYASAADLAADLTRYTKLEPIRARRIGPIVRTVRWCQRNPWLAAVSSAAATIILVLSGIYYVNLLIEKEEATKQRDAAEAANVKAQLERNAAQAANQQAQIDRDAAEAARERAQDLLTKSLFEQARAVRLSGKAGRRWEAMDLLKKAEALRTRDRKKPAAGADAVELPDIVDMRAEAIASLLASDLRLQSATNVAFQPTLSRDGRVAVGAWMEEASLIPKFGGFLAKDVFTGKDLGDLKHPLPMGAALSPDGRWLATVLYTPELTSEGVLLWQVGAPGVEKKLPWPKDVSKGGSPGLAFDSTGRYLATMHYSEKQGRLIVWDLERVSDKAHAPTKDMSMHHPVFAARQPVVAWLAGKNKIVLHDVAKDMSAGQFEVACESVLEFVFAPNDDAIALLCKDQKTNVVVIWDRVKNAETTRFQVGEHFFSQGMAFHPEGKWLAVADGISVVRFHDPETGAEAFRVDTGHKLGVKEIRWPSNDRLVTGGAEGDVRVWEFYADPLRKPLPVAAARARGLAFSLDGRWLALNSGGPGDGKIVLVDRATGKTHREFTPGGQPIFRSDSKRLVVHRFGDAFVWDIESGEKLGEFGGAKHTPVGVGFSADGDLRVVHSADGKIIVRDVGSDRTVMEMEEAGRPVKMSEDGTLLMVSANKSKEMRVIDIPSGKTRLTLDSGRDMVIENSFSSRSRWLMTVQMQFSPFKKPKGGPAMGDCSLHFWRLADAKKHLDIALPIMPAHASLGADDTLLALLDSKNVIHLWNLETGAKVVYWEATTKNLNGNEQVALTPDGRTLVFSDSNAPLMFFDLEGMRRELTALGMGW